jgi:ABC-type molybdate transport system ATPase subunit
LDLLLSQSRRFKEADRLVELLRGDGVRNMRPWPQVAAEAGGGPDLALDPSLILLDEPAAGVDVKETRAFVQFIKEVTAGKHWS